MDVKFEDTAFYDWLKTNRWWLIAAVSLVCVVQGYSYFAPRIERASLQESWALYNDVMQNLDLENVDEALDRARQDSRVYPWVVMRATNFAMAQDQREALEILVPQLESLAESEVSEDLRVPIEGGATSMPAYLLEHARQQLAREDTSVENPTPTGERVEISVSLSSGDTYTVVAGLYPGVAPEVCDAFVAAVEAGRFDGQEGQLMGGGNAQWSGMAEDEVDEDAALPLERERGYFHAVGALTTVRKSGGALGEQDPDKVQLMLQSNFLLDGQTTVFGQVTSGLEELQAALQGAAPGEGFTVTSVTLANGSGPEGSGGEGPEDEG